MYSFTNLSIYIPMWLAIYLYLSIYLSICIFIYTYVYIYISIYIYISSAQAHPRHRAWDRVPRNQQLNNEQLTVTNQAS